MSRSKNIEVLAAVYEAFHVRKTWRQAELAQRIGVRPERLRTTLEALQRSGWDLERDEEPPQVYWSLPRHAFAGGVLVPKEEVPKLLRLLAYVPDSPERKEILRLFEGRPQLSLLDAVSPRPSLTTEEEAILRTIEEAMLDRRPLELKYFSQHRGELEWRILSCHRVQVEDAFRVLAVCHRDDRLKWFRLDAMQAAREAGGVDYRHRDEGEVEAFLQESIAGFHGGDAKEEHSFLVKEPDARWVRSMLRPPMRYEVARGGILVRVETASLLQVARLVLTLGGAATEVSPQLADEVRRLADGALTGLGPSSRGD